MKTAVDERDRTLLDLLQNNARASTAELARQLGLSRSTVKDRIERLQRRGIIRGYRVELGEGYEQSQIAAHVLISVDPKLATQVVPALHKVAAIKSLYTINGAHDLLALVRTPSTHALDEALDQIGALDGIERTVSSIILSTKFER